VLRQRDRAAGRPVHRFGGTRWRRTTGDDHGDLREDVSHGVADRGGRVAEAGSLDHEPADARVDRALDRARTDPRPRVDHGHLGDDIGALDAIDERVDVDSAPRLADEPRPGAGDRRHRPCPGRGHRRERVAVALDHVAGGVDLVVERDVDPGANRSSAAARTASVRFAGTSLEGSSSRRWAP